MARNFIVSSYDLKCLFYLQTPRSPPSTKTMSILGNFAQPLGKNVSVSTILSMAIEQACFVYSQRTYMNEKINWGEGGRITWKMTQKNPCKGKHKEFRNFAKTKGRLFAQLVNS